MAEMGFTLVCRSMAITLLGVFISLTAKSGGAQSFFHGQYPLLPVPPQYQGPSGEPGQIRLAGFARSVELFHGKSDDEADWHVYIQQIGNAARDLSRYLRPRGTNVGADKLANVYGEVMVIDRYSNSTFDEKFFSGDVSLAFRLWKSGSEHPAWDLGVQAANDQGSNHKFGEYSKLIREGALLYLQGPFVNDKEHGTLVEIHPLESIAFAMDAETERSIIEPLGRPLWPAHAVRWRVAFLGNSSFHRINGMPYMRHARRVAWFLDLPSDAYSPGGEANVRVDIVEQPRRLWDAQTGKWYQERGVRVERWSLATDPSDQKRKLKVSAVILVPDRRGGLAIRDYIIRVRPNSPAAPIRR